MLIYFHFLFLAFIPPAICLVMIYFAGCNKQMVVALLCATVGFNGLNFSSVSCNHIDIAPRFAGTLMGFTNSVANTMGFLAPQIIGKIIDGHVSNYEHLDLNESILINLSFMHPRIFKIFTKWQKYLNSGFILSTPKRP